MSDITWTRSRDKMVAGICQSIARQTKIDVNIVRLIVVVLTIATSGTVALIYGIAWLVLPLEGESSTHLDAVLGKSKQAYDDYKTKKASQPGSQPGADPKDTFNPYDDQH
ncbi:PspC domain-containing protein [Aestuariimicrobium kwangyangense]|uniref:PspC domain-containing protein n=1 Tax=Aestuariimicrobium kwangyangense TaxID=396389 RepID=UPI0003B46293|nr:PspC domain-containing protein [Aestuariimicrobium kwangyangense]